MLSHYYESAGRHEGLEGLAKDSAEMRRIAGRLDSEMDRLPLETLRQLEAAIDAHLANPGENVRRDIPLPPAAQHGVARPR